MTTIPASTSARPPRRPFGLNVIIILQLLTVLVSGGALLVIGFAVWASVAAWQTDLTADANIGLYEVVILVVTFLINLVCAVGLWRRRRWAWFLTMLQLGFFMLEDLYGHFTGASLDDYAWSMLLNVLMVFYLNQREVQAVFRKKGQDEPPLGSAPAHPAARTLDTPTQAQN